MSTALARHPANPNKTHTMTSHWRKNSGELDVFEAARYFSTSNDEKQRAARRSLDMPIMRSHPILPPEYHHMMILDHHDKKPNTKENKKYKQPSSPGGRLASFLNSLFSPTHLKKKKSKSGGNGEDESPAGRRKRRSSISHFRITSTANAAPSDKKATYSTSNTGFRTPPPYADTPTKVPAVSPPRNVRNFKITLLEELHAERNGFFNKKSNPLSEERGIMKFNDADDGADSDSSSDLFDLPNHDLDFFSSGLPVYETTRMDRIKIGAPISKAAATVV